MKDIRFRGKRVDNGEWIYGCLTKYSNYMSYICVDVVRNETYQVETKTVGQFTGLKDINGKEIYENDICTDSNFDKLLVQWSGKYRWECNIFQVDNSSNESIFPLWKWDNEDKDIEIIGNKYDNPVLLENYSDLELYVQKLQKDGYIDADGGPLKCRHCDSEDLENGVEYYGERGLEEYTVVCGKCKKITGCWAFGHWQLD